MSAHSIDFRRRLLGKEPLAGTFFKTPSAIAAEVLAYSSLDVVCIDTEHAPFGRVELDACIAQFRAAHKACIVRTQNDSSTEIRAALDSGASGILVPHVTTAAQAAAVAKAAHFGEGGRGYAGSTRAAEYTTKSMADHLADSARATSVIVQIEDLAALGKVAEIAAVDGIDAIFIGRVDLAVAMGKPVADPAVVDAVRNICQTASAEGATVGMFTPDLGELPEWRAAGATLFILGSDHGFVLAGANALATELNGE